MLRVRSCSRGRTAAIIAIVVALAFSLVPDHAVAQTAPAAGSADAGAVGIEVVSTRADAVAGDRVLVRVTVPGDIEPSQVQVLANDRDVSSSFRLSDRGELLGRIAGLVPGQTQLEVRLAESAGACPSTLPQSGFVDLGTTHARAIDCLLAYRITRGVTAERFGTNDPLLRQQLAVFLARSLAQVDGFALPDPVEGAFSDVTGGVAVSSIETLAGFDPPIVQGRADGTFAPTSPLTRAQLATFLVRAHEEVVRQRPGVEPLDEVDVTGFPDVDLGDTHGRAIAMLADAGVIGGFADGTFGPQATVTRGQYATLVTRLLDRWAQAGVLPLPAGVTPAPLPGSPTAKETLTVHPVTGPIFSGPHQQPFICRTAEWGLGEPLDEACSASTDVSWYYRTTSGAFAPLPDGERPDNLATTVTSLGEEVDYIVRVERGTVNRAVYQLAILADPDGPLPDPWTTTPGWNQRLVYSFGGGCNAGYHQGGPGDLLGGGVLEHTLLQRGYATASSTLNVNQNNCNDVVSAETALMVKQRFIDTYGEPLHTIGWGGSGGAIQQHLIAENYPGILDGLIPQISFPDNFSIAPGVVDCRLLNTYFNAAGGWTPEARTAVAGFATWETCVFWNLAFSSNIVPDVGCNASIPRDLIYDPQTNPTGARCTLLDHTVNVLGIDPDTGFARNPFDNTGVQYGLRALNDGAITVEQFVDLNASIGGYDADARNVPDRSTADPEALRILAATGRVVSGELGLAEVPIIDTRQYTDTIGDIHDRFRSFAIRERLLEAQGNADNHVIWIGTQARSALALEVMDEWLTAIGEDERELAAAELIRDNRPARATDACWTPAGERIDEPASYDSDGTCNQLYPVHAEPRIASGAPPARGDLAACVLRPVDPDDYAVELTPEQLAELEEIFPDGVCDYSQGNRVEAEPLGTWLSFADGPL